MSAEEAKAQAAELVRKARIKREREEAELARTREREVRVQCQCVNISSQLVGWGCCWAEAAGDRCTVRGARKHMHDAVSASLACPYKSHTLS